LGLILVAASGCSHGVANIMRSQQHVHLLKCQPLRAEEEEEYITLLTFSVYIVL
jgi:hypothetical protein